MSKKNTIRYRVLRSTPLPSGRVVRVNDLVQHKLFPEEGKVRIVAIRDMEETNNIELVIEPENPDEGFRSNDLRRSGNMTMRGTAVYFF